MGEREIRIGDAEREQAMGLLGEHLGEGRLTVDEYGERTALATAAKTRGDLLALFSDLPEPHPRFGQVAPPPSAPTPAPTSAPPARRTLDAKVLVPVVGILCVALFFLVKNPFVLLLVPLVALAIGSMGRR